jgi:Flp pilus assembly protein TadB
MIGQVLDVLRMIAPYLAGLSLASISYAILSQVQFEISSVRRSVTRRLEKFAGVEEEPTWLDRLGDEVLRFLSLDPQRWVHYLRWAQLGGYYMGWTVGGLVGRAVVYGLAGALYAAYMAAPFFWLAMPILFAFPFIRVRSKANDVKKQVRRALPELATLVAAEMAAGNAADRALARGSELAGPLGHVLARAMAEGRSTGRALFSRSREVRGAVLENLSGMGMPELMAFASQLDLVASKGAAGPELMDNIAQGLAREYRMRVLQSAEELESDLVIPATLFFFLPFVLAIMIPLLVPLLEAFG